MKSFLKFGRIFVFILFLLNSFNSFGQETGKERDDRMEWWREARFGMFVHWGLYSIAAGEWEGKTFGGGGQEWIQYYAGVPGEQYEKVLAPRFNPGESFASEWAKLARQAGCKYLVFTTKHHEGFALHDSKVGAYNAKALSGRDLVKEVVEACRKEGLRVGFYYSVIDWHHPHAYVGGGLPSIKGDTNEGRDHSIYVDYLHDQVKELVTNYGDVDVLWWDYSSPQVQGESWKAKELIAMVKEYQPSIIMNNRLYAKVKTGGTDAGGFDLEQGDFITPEQKIPANGIEGVDWETCMTMNGTWGYSKFDDNWKSTKVLLQNLVDIASKGGNYLLNIGPKADGSVPVESIERMKQIGEWMKINGESVYGTTANPLRSTPWGRCTQKIEKEGTRKLYLHIFDFPENNVLTIENEELTVKRAYYLNGKSEVPFENKENLVRLTLSPQKKDSYNTVIVIEQ